MPSSEAVQIPRSVISSRWNAYFDNLAEILNNYKAILSGSPCLIPAIVKGYFHPTETARPRRRPIRWAGRCSSRRSGVLGRGMKAVDYLAVGRDPGGKARFVVQVAPKPIPARVPIDEPQRMLGHQARQLAAGNHLVDPHKSPHI